MKKEDFLRETVEHIDIKSFDARGIMEGFERMAFQARNLATAAGIFDRMLRDSSCAVILTLAGSLFSAGLKKVVVDMTLNFLMDAQDIYFAENDEFYPLNGKINIKKGKGEQIPALAYTFPSAHKHRYIIYGKNTDKVNSYYVEVRADYDFDKNGDNDRFRYTTLYSKGKKITYRELQQYN